MSNIPPTSDSSQQPTAPAESPEPVDPDAVLQRLTDHMASNPFATDRKTVMVAAQGRVLKTAVERLKSNAAEAAKLEREVEASARTAVAILQGTHPGLTAGGRRSR